MVEPPFGQATCAKVQSDVVVHPGPAAPTWHSRSPSSDPSLEKRGGTSARNDEGRGRGGEAQPQPAERAEPPGLEENRWLCPSGLPPVDQSENELLGKFTDG